MSDTSLQVNYLITAKVGGELLSEPFDTWTPPTVTRANTRRRHGGQTREKIHAGFGRYDSGTLGRDHSVARDHARLKGLYTSLTPVPVEVYEQPLDAERRPFGDAVIYTGWLDTAARGAIDVNSEDARDLEIKVAVETVA